MTHKQGMNLSMGIGEHLDTLKSGSGSCALFMRPTTFFSTKLSLKIDLMILFAYRSYMNIILHGGFILSIFIKQHHT